MIQWNQETLENENVSLFCSICHEGEHKKQENDIKSGVNTKEINECRLASLKIMNNLLIFFNQNDYPMTKKEMNDLQVDDLISIYELLLEQNLYKKREMDRVKT